MRRILISLLTVILVVTASSKAHALLIYDGIYSQTEQDRDAVQYNHAFTALSCTVLLITIIWIPVCLFGEDSQSNSFSTSDVISQGYTQEEAQVIKSDLTKLGKALSDKKAKMALRKHETAEEIKTSVNSIFPISDLTAGYLSDISGR